MKDVGTLSLVVLLLQRDVMGGENVIYTVATDEYHSLSNDIPLRRLV